MSGEMAWFAEVVVSMAKVTSAGPGSPGVTRQALSTLPASTTVAAAAEPPQGDDRLHGRRSPQ